MNIRTIVSFVLVCFSLILGGCAGAVKILPDGKRCLGTTTAGDNWDRSSTYVALYECRKEGEKLIVGNEIKPGDTVHGQSVVGQVAISAMGGTGAALVNGGTARSVAEKGQCKGGGNCGTVINNQVASVAEALNNNDVKIGVGTSAPAACVATNTCGK